MQGVKRTELRKTLDFKPHQSIEFNGTQTIGHTLQKLLGEHSNTNSRSKFKTSANSTLTNPIPETALKANPDRQNGKSQTFIIPSAIPQQSVPDSYMSSMNPTLGMSET